jgi:hypothetical protein
VRLYTFIAFIIVLFIATACPSIDYDSAQKRLKQNNMDFADPKKEFYKGIRYMLSDMFVNGYNSPFTLSTDADTKIIYDLAINFSVEAFDPEEAEVIQFRFDKEIALHRAVHENYILRRQQSLAENTTTIIKETPKSVSFPGYIQTVHGSQFGYNEASSYFTATLEVDGSYYVFQMIGKKENMGYLYDDFIDILTSVAQK